MNSRVVWSFGRRGLFSEILIAAEVVAFSRVNKVDCQIFCDHLSNLTYDFLKEAVNFPIKKTLVPISLGNVTSDRLLKLYQLAVKYIYRSDYSQNKVLDLVWRRHCSNTIDQDKRHVDFMNKIVLDLLDTAKNKEIRRLIEKEIPDIKNCAVIHIRRGDKIIQESVMWEYEVYKSYIPHEIKKVIVLSDTSEVVDYLRSTWTDVKVEESFAVKSFRSYSQQEFNKKNSRDKIEQHEAALIDMWIMSLSGCLIADFKSNIAKCAYIVRNGSGCNSLGEFKYYH